VTVEVVGKLIIQWHRTVLPDVDCQTGHGHAAHPGSCHSGKVGEPAWKNTASQFSGGMDTCKEFDAYWSGRVISCNPTCWARDFICKSVLPGNLWNENQQVGPLLLPLIGGVSSGAYQDKTRDKYGASLPEQTMQTSDDDDDEPEPLPSYRRHKSSKRKSQRTMATKIPGVSSKQKGCCRCCQRPAAATSLTGCC
jgi:hypothetical protein